MKIYLIIVALLITGVANSQVYTDAQGYVRYKEPKRDTIVLKDTVYVDKPSIVYRDTCLNPPTPPPTNNYGTIVLETGFENSADVNTQQGQYNSRSSTIKKEGSYSFRSEVRANQPALHAGYRSEMQYGVAPQEGVLEYWCYFENWRKTIDGGHVIQFHPQSSTGSAVMSLQAYNGTFLLVRNINGTNYFGSKSMTVPSNQWVKIRIEFKFVNNNTGYIKLYINDVLFDQMLNVVTTDQYGIPYLKVGQNRWLAGNAIQDTTVIYYDGVRLYKK